MKQLYITTILLFSFFASFAQVRIKLDTFSRSYPAPVAVENDGNTSRVFVVCQTGLILVLDSNGTKLDTFIDLRSKVQSSGEEGLLDMAFHPDYANNGYFYTYYTKKNLTDEGVYRYKVSANPNRAAKDSELLLLTIPHPTNTNHNGGCLRFGKDGYLYISTGDGGGAGDVPNNAQNKNQLLGKILRLDVHRFDTTYTIPPTNPLVAQSNVKKEIWAMGLRNPWKYSFDRQTGDLWIGDVGQGAWEEIDFQAAGDTAFKNYGWRCYEGFNTYNTSGCLAASNYKFPIYAYDHGSSGGIAVIGGSVYRGNKYNDLKGYYLFTDYGSANFWVTKKTDTVFTTTALGKVLTGANVSGFGEDIRGEIYATNVTNGVVYKIRELCTPFHINLVSAINPSCPNVLNGSIQMSSAGSNGSVAFTWSNTGSGSTITNLGPGKYVVTATDAIGCVRKDSFVLSNADTLKITVLNLKNPTCPGVSNGQIDITGFGGNHFYTYNWSNGNLDGTNDSIPPGFYKVTVMDGNGCTAKDSFTLHNVDTLLIHLAQSINPSCPDVSNGRLDVQASDGTVPFSYNWSNGPTSHLNDSLPAGSYTVVAHDLNNCAATDSFTLYNQDTLDKPIITQVANYLQTDPGFTYQWKRNGSDIPGATHDTIHPSVSGTYRVEITDVNGCKATSDTFSFALTGIKINRDIEKFAIYPNPANNNITIDIGFVSSRSLTIKVSNSIGQIVYEEKLQGKDISKDISLKQLPKGMYEISVYTDDGIKTKTFMKE